MHVKGMHVKISKVIQSSLIYEEKNNQCMNMWMELNKIRHSDYCIIYCFIFFGLSTRWPMVSIGRSC